jgi:hypothetical protein
MIIKSMFINFYFLLTSQLTQEKDSLKAAIEKEKLKNIDVSKADIVIKFAMEEVSKAGSPLL